MQPRAMVTSTNGLPDIISENIFPIVNTKQYIDYKSFVDSGIMELQSYLHTIDGSTHCGYVEIEKLTADLLIIAKELTTFLQLTTAAFVHKARFGDRKLQYSDKAWPTTAITELRVACHRYSLTVMQITMANEELSLSGGRKTRTHSPNGSCAASSSTSELVGASVTTLSTKSWESQCQVCL